MAPLPAAFLAALEGGEVVLVSSRSARATGTVPMGFAATPDGAVYLLTQAFSLKAQRWERDPWVRLREPRSGIAVEATVRRVEVAELDDVGARLGDSFLISGAATPEALRRLLEARTHVLLRVEGGAQAG